MSRPSDWQALPAELADDSALADAVLQAHQELWREAVGLESASNPAIGFDYRALRRIDAWRVLLLLTPWMLVRLLFPDHPPDLQIPEAWRPARRSGAPYQVLGPLLRFELLGQSQQGHLNHHPRLGHFLLQPLCLNMEPYASAEAVFEAWNQVIETREENLRKLQRDCPLQQEVSRREFFRRFKAPPG
jgi:hypothetical protein